MSVKVSTWAWELQCVKGMTKLVLMALADSADDDGFCWPKLDTIASKASTSRSTVKRAIKELADLNLLSVEHRERENGASATNYYWVNVGHNPDLYVQDVEGAKMNPSRTSEEQTEQGGVQNEPGEGFTCDPGRGSMVNPHNEPSFKPSITSPLPPKAGGGAALADKNWKELCENWELRLGDSFEQAKRPWANLDYPERCFAVAHAKAFQKDNPKVYLKTYLRNKRWQSYEQAAQKTNQGQFVFIEKGSPQWAAWSRAKGGAIFASFNKDHRKFGCYQRTLWPQKKEDDNKLAG
nr:helix-turn-helix domain-containing protein [uncultured Cohaesibacter sp.]